MSTYEKRRIYFAKYRRDHPLQFQAYNNRQAIKRRKEKIQKSCLICGKMFIGHTKTKTCSKTCSKENGRRLCKKWINENPEYVRQWYKQNADKKNDYQRRRCRRYWGLSVEQRKLRNRISNSKRPDQILRLLKWAEENPERAKEARARWSKMHPDKIRTLRLRYHETLPDFYVAAYLKIPIKYLPPEIIAAKREQIKLKRLLKDRNYANQNDPRSAR